MELIGLIILIILLSALFIYWYLAPFILGVMIGVWVYRKIKRRFSK